MNDKAVETVNLRFAPVKVRVGDYFPAEFELLDGVVIMKVPITEENFSNYKRLLDNPTVQPELTPVGFRWCYNQLRDMMAPEPEPEEPSDEDEEWN